MTNRRRRRSKSRWIVRLLFLVLIIGAVVVAYLVWDNYFKEKDDEPREQTSSQEEKPVESDKKEEKKEEKEGEEKESFEEKEKLGFDGEDPNTSSELTGAITYADVINDQLVIRLNIDQFLNGGNCRLVLTQGGEEVYGEEVAIVNSAATSTCEGFNVLLNDIGINGNVGINIRIESDGKVGVISGEAKI